MARRFVWMLSLAVTAVTLIPAVRAQAPVQPPVGYPAVGGTPIVTVVAPGAEPRRPLRFVVPFGRQDHMTMDMTLGLTMSMPGMEMPSMKMPTMRVGVDLGVTSVSPGGDMSFKMAYTDMKWVNTEAVDPSIVSALQALPLDITKISGTGVMSSRGIGRNIKIDLPKDLDPQMTQMFGSMSDALGSFTVPFPEEAIGIGGRWEVRQSLVAGGVTSFQKITVEVTGLDARTVTVKTTMEQQAPPQPMKSDTLPAGATASVEKMSGSGTGTISMPLDSLVPTSDATITTSLAMTVNMAGQTQSMTVQTTVGAAIRPVKK
jgi:hypothetical protein